MCVVPGRSSSSGTVTVFLFIRVPETFHKRVHKRFVPDTLLKQFGVIIEIVTYGRYCHEVMVVVPLVIYMRTIYIPEL